MGECVYMTNMTSSENTDQTVPAEPAFVSRGECRLCGKTFPKTTMTNHLKACLREHTASAPAGKTAESGFLLIVDGGRYAPEYWLFLTVPAKTTFGALDAVLRDIWLECCGHMSAFRFPQPKIKTARPKSFADILAHLDVDQQMADDNKLMEQTLASKLRVGNKFFHEYDFGTTTTLELRVLAKAEMPVAKKSGIRLLARNEPPPIPCHMCNAPSAMVCVECMWDGTGWVCKKCARKHSCGDDMMLPIVNSPRVGQCGYCGPSIEP
jgi:hypothetical protein